MDNFDARKWFKKQYLAEDKSDNDKVVAKGEGIEITQDQMKRLHNGEVVRLSNGSTLSFVKEGHTEDKMERDQAIRRFDQLSNDDKLKLAKIQAMMDRERSLREDDLNEDRRRVVDYDNRDDRTTELFLDNGDSVEVDVIELYDNLKENNPEDLDEIAFGAAGTDKRTGQVVGEIIELIRSTGVDVYEVMEELGQEFGMDVRPQFMNTLLENRIEGLLREKLCKKGQAYRKRRMAAGEKSSAYLSGRAVKVCKGQMSGKKKKKTNEIEDRISESLRDWFKKEDWVRIDTQGNISGKCGTMKNKKNPSRCLPRKKAQSLTKAERKSSAQKKKREGKKGKQFVKNPK